MQAQRLNQMLKQKLGRDIMLEPAGNDRYLVLTPFMMDDGDHYTIVLQRHGHQWSITDEGDTFMHLSYRMDDTSLKNGIRQEIIEQLLTQYGIQNRDGELRIDVVDDQFSLAVFSFLQALIRITDVSFLMRERIRTYFLEDFRTFLRQTFPNQPLIFDYYHPIHDQKRIYPIDAMIQHPQTPLYIFAIQHDERCRDVTIQLHTYKSWHIHFQSIAIFENQQHISRDVLARFSDIVDKQFSSLVSSERRIEQYLLDQLQ